MKARVTVTLKSGVLDPQGKAIEGALASLGITGVESVRQGKVFDVEVAEGVGDPEGTLRGACERLLANTVIENFRIEVNFGSLPAGEPAPSPDGAPEQPGAADEPETAEEPESDPTQVAAQDTEMPVEGHP